MPKKPQPPKGKPNVTSAALEIYVYMDRNLGLCQRQGKHGAREPAAAGRRTSGRSGCLRAARSSLGGGGRRRHPTALQLSTAPLLSPSDCRRAADTLGVAKNRSCADLLGIQMLPLLGMEKKKKKKRGKQKGKQSQANKSWVTLFAGSQTQT